MDRSIGVVSGIVLGALAMYLFDPAQGRRRRAGLRQLATHAASRASAVAGMTARDVEHRTGGVVARTVAGMMEAGVADDAVLEARVRSRVGRLVSHPHAIGVKAASGHITLSGPVFETEVRQLLEGVGRVPGVAMIDNRLEAHAGADRLPALQGRGPKRVAGKLGSWRWTPTARLAAGATGLALLAISKPNRPVRGAAARVTGMELLERAFLG